MWLYARDVVYVVWKTCPGPNPVIPSGLLSVPVRPLNLQTNLLFCIFDSGFKALGNKMKIVVFIFCACVAISEPSALRLPENIRIRLPVVPPVVYPPVPDDARLSDDEVQSLQESAQDPESRPGLFQGDMAMTNEIYKHWRVGLRWDVFPEKLWTNNTVPYVISPLYDADDYVTIYTAIRTINFMTCVKFVPWNGKDKDFLLIWPIKYPKGCWSFVGKFGGPQIVSLQAPDANGPNCLGTEGRSIHELLHALGIFHEQSRADRDNFVSVHLDNVIPELQVNFDKQSLENTTYTFEYDYDSIMHYGRYFFSKEKGKPTITPKMPGIRQLGQRKAMSKTDCLKVNDLYGCLTKSVAMQRKYYSICQNLGL